MSRLDQVYRSLLLTKFFTKGWGNPENLKRLFEFRKIISCRETCQQLVSPDYPVHIDKDETQRDCRIVEGHFISPFTKYLPGIMPKETETARFQVILPKIWQSNLKPVCLHLAGTGDHYYWRRRAMLARPLLKESGIASILLENPYYGVRKPAQQVRSSLHNVSDLFVMGGALVLESLVLFHWCERQGYGPLGISGISMGGYMASVAATNWHKPVSLVPILSWSTASTIFTEGVMSGAIPWKLLQEQYFSDSTYEDEIAKLVHSPEKNNPAFEFGRDFARNYPTSVSKMEKLQNQLLQSDSNLVKADCFSSPPPGGLKLEGEGHMNATTLGQSSSSQAAKFHTMSFENPISRPPSRSYSDKPSESLSYIDRLPLPRFWKQEGNLQREVLDFMRGIMDECTHLGNFSVPVDPGLVIIVIAKSDAYVPRGSVLSLQDLWPGAEVRSVDCGHITAFLFKQGEFRKAITDAFNKQISRYYS